MCIRDRQNPYFSNYIYGAYQKVILCPLTRKGEGGQDERLLETDKALQEVMQFKSDMHFPNFEEQMNRNSNKETKELVLGDTFITKHTNLGGYRYMFSVYFKSMRDFHGDDKMKFLRALFDTANENLMRKITIPVEFWIRDDFGHCNWSNKMYGDLVTKFLRAVKREINQFSQDYPMIHTLNTIEFILPQFVENSQALYQKAIEIIKLIFE
eukprot:TRINITY_DN32602_c0_g1_i1.p1 TRINITY_DN32602_c0_g1~~TRINITY_DN32602_c0_g1_i1.p1  ORF type:complete len:230 (+),score=55.54 TRINITY_DN32602_c0_g1_i1:60-692(+)